MLKIFKRFIQNFGYDIVKSHKKNKEFPQDFSEKDIKIINSVLPFTMTSHARIFSLIRAVEYIIRYNIPGDIVECGVWKGGSMMAVAKVLLEEGKILKDLYLFDTFEGMPEPGKFDLKHDGRKATELYANKKISKNTSSWCYSSIKEVKKNLFSTGYDPKKINFVKGRVEETITKQAPPAEISLLRLDTDWYESTLHELEHLFPKLSSGGILIIDDYGDWMGAKKAVDQYFAEKNVRMLLNRIDNTGRIGVKI